MVLSTAVAHGAPALTVGYEAPDAASLVALTDAVHAAAAARGLSVLDDTAITGLRHDGLLRLSAREPGAAVLLVSARLLSDGRHLIDVTGVSPGGTLVRRYRVAPSDLLGVECGRLFAEALSTLGAAGRSSVVAPPPAAAGEADDSLSTWGIVSLASAGVGLLAIGSAVLFGTEALSARDAANACAESAGEGAAVCPRPEYDAYVADSERAALVADVSWILAAAGGAAAVVAYFKMRLDEAGAAPAGWALVPGPAGAGLVCSF